MVNFVAAASVARGPAVAMGIQLEVFDQGTIWISMG